MKTHILALFLGILFISAAIAQTKKAITVEDIFSNHSFSPKGYRTLTWNSSSNGLDFMDVDKTNKTKVIREENVDGSESSEILNQAQLGLTAQGKKPIQIDSYRWSKNGTYLLIISSTSHVWRRSSTAHYFAYSIKTKKTQPVFDEQITNVHFSPDEKKIGFVFKNDIYVKSLIDGSLTQLTHDGSENIINGKFDWVYEEEFSATDGWKWAPDGKSIAFWRLDQSHEPEFSWTDFDELHGKVETIRYPKAGDPNALVQIGIINVADAQTRWLDLGKDTDIYIPRIYWRPDGEALFVEKMNRRQNKLELLSFDSNSLMAASILTETDPAWVEVFDNLYFLPDGDHFTWTSERDGYCHIYLYDVTGETHKQLTQGSWVVQKLYGTDGENIYFAANKGDVLQQHIFAVNIKSGTVNQLTTAIGWHSARFAPDFAFFIDTWSNSKEPYQAVLRNNSGKKIRQIYKSTIKDIAEYQINYPEYLTFTTSDGQKLNGQITKPINFDATKKYPVLIYCYGGPGVQVVRNAWGGSRNLWHSMLAQKGYLVFSIDNRGSNGRGKIFKNYAYDDLGKWPLNDQIEGVKYLASLPYVDKSRIGIWGWSFGAYLTLMAMTKGSNYFKAGIAVAPVTDFRLYDTIYTERYMDKPVKNPAGYDSTSVLTHVDNYKNGLLVVHGSSDDNVHMQNTMQFVEKMEIANKQFELMIYPGKNHGLPGRAYDLYTMMTNFILKNL